VRGSGIEVSFGNDKGLGIGQLLNYQPVAIESKNITCSTKGITHSNETEKQVEDNRLAGAVGTGIGVG
jgi:hypothetical protein